MSKQPLPHQHGRAKASVDVANSDEKSASSSSKDGPAPHTTAAVGDKDSLNSSDEDDNEASGVTDSG